MSKIPISENTLEKLFGDLLTSSLCVNIEKGTKMWVATGMLIEQLESFTDSVLVRENDKPIGIVGGKDVLEELLHNPTSELFDESNVEDIMEGRIPFVTKESTLRELIEFWKNTRRAFGVIPNEFSDYSVISTKKLLEVGKRCKTNICLVDLPKKKVVTFSKDSTIGKVLELMFENNTRRLLLKNSTKFINDRMILEKITEELRYLRGVDDFLETPVEKFSMADAKIVPRDTKISEASEGLYKMEHPYLMFDDQVVSPWDICVTLLSDKLTDYDYPISLK